MNLRRSTIFLAVTLLAGCSAGVDEFVFSGLPPESYWVVTREYLDGGMVGGEPRCPQFSYRDAARLSFQYPSTVTLAILKNQYNNRSGVDPYPAQGTVSADSVTLAQRNNQTGKTDTFVGEFSDSDHFVLRGFEADCPMQIAARRYAGPQVCEVASQEEVAEIVATMRKAVAQSGLASFREFAGAQLPALYDVSITEFGTYAQAGTAWTLVATTTDGLWTFVFESGEVAKTLPSGLTITSPTGWRFEMEWRGNDLPRLSFNDSWVVDFSGTMLAPFRATSLVGPPVYLVGSYETPFGNFRWNQGRYEVNYSRENTKLGIISNPEATTLTFNGNEKAWSKEERDAFCPLPGLDVIRAFPDLLAEFGLCEAFLLTNQPSCHLNFF